MRPERHQRPRTARIPEARREPPFWSTTPATACRRSAPSSPTPRSGYNWHTYPERLLAAGVTWKIYQDKGVGLDAAGAWGWADARPYTGNYGCNSLLYFLQYQNAAPGSPLFEASRSGTQIYNSTTGTYNNGTLFDQLRADVMNNTLPQVSWIPAPEAYCEHPNYPANYGAWYVSNVLSALTSNPAVFASTVFIICYDENDGFFDHIVPPTPPMNAAQGKSTVSTVNEIYPGTTSANFPAGPYGLGARVPALVISPWSKGGWVCSEVFDHTSTIQLHREALRGDRAQHHAMAPRRLRRHDVGVGFLEADREDLAHPEHRCAMPPPASDISGNVTEAQFPAGAAGDERACPRRSPVTRPSRALPYKLQADGAGQSGQWNHRPHVHQHRRRRRMVPRAHGQQLGGRRLDRAVGLYGRGGQVAVRYVDRRRARTAAYDLSVYGAQRILPQIRGQPSAGRPPISPSRPTTTRSEAESSSIVTNAGAAPTTVTVTDQYTGTTSQQAGGAGRSLHHELEPARRATGGTTSWSRRAPTPVSSVKWPGVVETGAHGITDPYL